MLLYAYNALFTDKVAHVIYVSDGVKSVWLKKYSTMSVKFVGCSHGGLHEARMVPFQLSVVGCIVILIFL